MVLGRDLTAPSLVNIAFVAHTLVRNAMMMTLAANEPLRDTIRTATEPSRPGPSSPFPFGPRPPGRDPPLPDRSPSGSIGLVLFDLLAQVDDSDGVRTA